MPTSHANYSPDLDRFLSAQDGIYAQALAELRACRKQSHWMWFIFPQLRGLGHSATAQHFGIAGAAEARAYAAHPVLGERLWQCTQAVLACGDIPVEQIFGYPDHLKFHSSMTLFAEAAELPGLFVQALSIFFGQRGDPATLALLNAPRL